AASSARANASLTDAASAPAEAEAAVAAKAAESVGKRGLGHATAEAMQDAKSDAKPKTSAASAPQPADTGAADKSTTSAQTFQRSSASEIALQAVMAKATGTPADIRVAGLEGSAGTTPQSADGAAPAPSVTIRAIAAATSLPGTPVQPQTPAREIAINMARNLANGTNRFEIRLDPAELGRIDVRMELGTDGRVQAHLTVEKPETLEMLQRDARALEKALSDAGLDMENGSLGYSLRDDSEGSGFAANRNPSDGADTTTPSDDDLTADLAAIQHIYALKAGSGSGVDIRI
ncbi:MAG: flagellar hook-length control protein FliK, partial [Candidatus Phaeomarinobacter sp.]